MSIVLIVIIVLFIIGMFSSDDSDNSHKNTTDSKTSPPNYRYWNGVEFNGSEVRCDWCCYQRIEKETGRNYCAKYPVYIDLNYVCDSYISGVEQLAEGLSKIIMDEKNQ